MKVEFTVDAEDMNIVLLFRVCVKFSFVSRHSALCLVIRRVKTHQRLYSVSQRRGQIPRVL